MTKKGRHLFGGRKVHPQTKSWLHLWLGLELRSELGLRLGLVIAFIRWTWCENRGDMTFADSEDFCPVLYYQWLFLELNGLDWPGNLGW